MIPNNVKLIAVTAVLLGAFSSGWYVNGLLWESRSDELLAEQEKRLIGQCEDQKKTTREIDHATLSKLRARDDRVAEYKRLHTPACVPVARTPSIGNAAGGGRVDARPHAVADYALVDYAAIAERYRVQLVGCQEFINRVWDSK